MTDSEQGAAGAQHAATAPFDPIAELNEISAEVLANPRIKFSEEDYDALDRDQIGYDESVHPYLF